MAVIAAIGLVAAASCGDDDDATEGTAAERTEAIASTDGGSTEPPPADGAEQTFEAGPGEHHLEEDEGEPAHGGTLVYGIEADTANAWAHYRASISAAGFVPLSAISDPLMAHSAEGELMPLLLESIEPSADYTEWTMTVRDGITFHDGTPLDGAAVKFNIDACRGAPISAGPYSSIGKVTAHGQTVTITTQGGPWVALPEYFAGGSCSYMLSPRWLGSLEDVPQRSPESPVYDAALAATPANGDPAKPVGLGAFVFDSYTPGNGNVFRAVRNEDYWRGSNGVTGEDLPYLDAIEAVVVTDVDSRANGLRSGQFDIIQVAQADTISEFLDDDEFETISTSRYGETGYTLLNVAEGDTDPDGDNANSPLLNVHCRRALAHATDLQRIADERYAGLVEPANGPFPPGSIGYLDDTGYPEYDPDKAVEEMDICLSELGQDGIEFDFNTIQDPFNVETNQLTAAMWMEVFGDQVNARITGIEHGQYIGLALTGSFNALSFQNHGFVDPDQNRPFWHGASASPISQVATNFGRIKDPSIDKALDTIKTNPAPAARKAAAENINRIFGEQAYNLWTAWTLWGIIEQPYVNAVESATFPDGTKAAGLVGKARHSIAAMWCDDGACE